MRAAKNMHALLEYIYHDCFLAILARSVAGRATERRKAGFHHLHSSERDLVSCDL
jgi:hypothetical protein